MRGFMECTVCHEIFRPHPGEKILFSSGMDRGIPHRVDFRWPRDYCECCALICGLQDYCELVLVRAK